MAQLAEAVASGSPVTPRSTAAVRIGAHRVIFVDLARAIAVAFMIQGHTLDALLGPEHRSGPLFALWVFQRGLTSCMFLLLAGFAFSIATSRHWAQHMRPSWQLVRRVRRFGFFVLLGYGLHFPVARFAELGAMGDERWRSFLAVDVLQLIGVTLIIVQALVIVARSQRAFAVAALAACGLLVIGTAEAWRIDWSRWLPLSIASYLSPATGSQFPLIPWSAYVLLGAALGQVYSHWGAAHLAAFANRMLLGGGAGMLVAANVFSRVPLEPFGRTDFWSTSPNQFLIRAGSVLVGLGAMAHLSRRLSYLPHIFYAVAQESLLVYFVHLCIVYGSVWNDGLRSTFGTTLSPSAAALVIVALIAAMTLLAWIWNWCKHAHGRVARVISGGAIAWLIWGLL